jgi:hypothetical protein
MENAMDRDHEEKRDEQEETPETATPLFQRSADQEYVLATLKPPGTTKPGRLAA